MAIIGKEYKNDKKRWYLNCECEICGSLFERRKEKTCNISKCNKCTKKESTIKRIKTVKEANKAKPKVYCCVDGCDREAMYKTDKLCQKHYFRRMRYGTFELTSTRKYKIYTPNGYCKVYEPNCELSDKTGYVFEHRFVCYSNNVNISKCKFCNKELTWNSVHIDHIDNDRLNNILSNLRPLCNGCNTQRPKREKKDKKIKQLIFV